MNKEGITKVLLSVILILTAVFWVAPRISESACGAAASSCKNCHEVKGEMSVNAKGAHHVQHAFGDFCVFCHSGNTAATVKAEAHQGMVEPLADVQKSCSACHPDDFEKRAQGYGAAASSKADAGSEAPASEEEAPYILPPTPDPSAVKGEDLVDYNLGIAAEQAETQADVAAVEAEAPGEEAEPPETGGSRLPVLLGILAVIGIVVYFLFRGK